MHVGVFQEPFKTGEEFSDIVMTGLDVDEQQGMGLPGPLVNPVYDFVGDDHPVHLRLARLPLSHHGDEVQGRLHRSGRVGLLPAIHLLLQPLQHLFLGEFPQNPHFFRQRITVIGDDPPVRQDRTGERGRGDHRPAALSGNVGTFAGFVVSPGRALFRVAALSGV